MRQSPQFNPKPDDEADVTRPGFGPGLTGLRKKGTGVRAWLVLDSTGQAQVVEAGKHSIMRRTGLPARDLRILDPLLSYPSTVLGREKAIVINLEHIKAIITAQEVLLLNSKDPSVTPFVEELQRRLLRLHQATKNQEARGSADNAEWTDLYDLEGTRSTDASPPNESYGFPQAQGTKDEKDNMVEKQDLKNRDVVKVLPFEFIALEACLEAACSSLDNEARTLEQEAHPALDKLTSKISTLNLERVRQIKSRLVALTGRVQKNNFLEFPDFRYARNGHIHKARQVFEKMLHRTTTSWNSTIAGYCQVGRLAEARELFDEMPKKNVISWTVMINGYAKNQKVDVARMIDGIFCFFGWG